MLILVHSLSLKAFLSGVLSVHMAVPFISTRPLAASVSTALTFLDVKLLATKVQRQVELAFLASLTPSFCAILSSVSAKPQMEEVSI